jgi:hypothetical protein
MAPGATSPSPSLTRRVRSLSPIGGEGQKRRIPLSACSRGERVGLGTCRGR